MQRAISSVRVSASTSNLGPGFDLAGLALDLFLDVEMLEDSTCDAIGLELGAGCSEWPRAENNLLVRALVAALERRRIAARRLVLRVNSQIPLARGFGSSGAACVAAVLLADSLAQTTTPRAELLAECIALEGHPDNATPALLGGFTLSFTRRPASAGPPRLSRRLSQPSAKDNGSTISFAPRSRST
jgi:homoserine kinase